jgi:ubiquinone/menaquinone biosynthesis C-methylase UbiE
VAICGWYSRKVFPGLLDWTMNQATLKPIREGVLAQTSGNILEIGFGTGVNLPCYPSAVSLVTAIDPNPGMVPFARSYASNGNVMVRWSIASAERLPFADMMFDTVVSTWALCSIPQVSLALSEIYRVLKPNGRFLFLEHGQSPDRSVRWWQDRLTPYWKYVGNGCHLNRPMSQLIQSQSWDLPSLKTFYFPWVPKPFAYFYQGCAVKRT